MVTLNQVPFDEFDTYPQSNPLIFDDEALPDDSAGDLYTFMSWEAFLLAIKEDMAWVDDTINKMKAEAL